MSSDQIAFTLRSEDVVTEQFEGDFVVLDLVGGRYYALDGAAALIWQTLMTGATLGAILEVAPEDKRADIRALVDQIRGFNLIMPRDDAPAEVELPNDLGTLSGAIGIQVFDDLAELLIADPIHDVDEQAGWPHRKD